MTLLALDVGNTHTVLGIFEGKDLRANWRIAPTFRRRSQSRSAPARRGSATAVCASFTRRTGIGW